MYRQLVNKPFVRVPYVEAIKYLQEEIAKDPSKWQFPEVDFGTDLATEHERWLCETKVEYHFFPPIVISCYCKLELRLLLIMKRKLILKHAVVPR